MRDSYCDSLRAHINTASTQSNLFFSEMHVFLLLEIIHHINLQISNNRNVR
jgi:hypothetical protein